MLKTRLMYEPENKSNTISLANFNTTVYFYSVEIICPCKLQKVVTCTVINVM